MSANPLARPGGWRALLMVLWPPFPRARATGFSAYRFPGCILHLLLLALFVLAGMGQTLWHPVLQPFMAVFIFAGLYLGRDLAILAHYIPLLSLVIIGGFIALLVFPPALKVLLVPDHDLTTAVAVITLVTLVSVAWTVWRVRAIISESNGFRRANGA